MTVDEGKRAELILSDEIADLSESQVEEFREMAKALLALVEGDPPMMREARSQMLSMMRMLRPLTGEDIQRIVTKVDDDPPSSTH